MNSVRLISDVVNFSRKIIVSPFNLINCIIARIATQILKACIFQEAAFQGNFFGEKVFSPVARIIVNIWQKFNGINNPKAAFDSQRLLESQMLLGQFAEEKVAKTPDGQEITYMLFKAERFQKWVIDNGGKIINNKDHVLITAEDETSWAKLQDLRNFKCFEEVKKGFKIPKFLPRAKEKCILFCQGIGRQIPMNKRFIGLYLAAGFNFVVFNWRREVNLEKYFEDAEAVYNALISEENFTPNQIVAVGECRSTFMVSYLKEKYHLEGLEAVLVHPITSLRHVIEVKNSLIRKVGLLGLKGLEKTKDLFDNLKRLKRMGSGKARTIFILNKGDKILPKNTKELFQKTVEKSVICEIPVEDKNNAHFRNPLLDEKFFVKHAKFLVSNDESVFDEELISS
jgi:hypothetical protein